MMIGDPQMEGDGRVRREGLYGHVNNILNDWMYRNIAWNVKAHARPHAVFVLGDLLSSQHLPDDEFNKRVDRYRWCFASHNYPLLVNLTGNHDVGYANEISPRRLRRWEAAMGAVNQEHVIGGHLFGVLNAMSLEPSLHEEPHEAAWAHVARLAAMSERQRLPLLLLTHIPLHKAAGHCLGDGPYVRRRGNSTVISEQNMLTEETSARLLAELRPRLIFTGHDHVGCFYRHSEHTFESTVRAIQGDYHGYTLLLTIVPRAAPHRDDERVDASDDANADADYDAQRPPRVIVSADGRFEYRLTPVYFFHTWTLVGSMSTAASSLVLGIAYEWWRRRRARLLAARTKTA